MKKKGNDAMKKGQLEEAIQFYSQAVARDPSNHVLYSNRCAAYMKQEKFDEALEDASTTTKLKPDWSKVLNWTLLLITISIVIYSHDVTVVFPYSKSLSTFDFRPLKISWGKSDTLQFHFRRQLSAKKMML